MIFLLVAILQSSPRKDRHRASFLDHGQEGQAATDQWAERAGIQVIRYATPKGSHAELGELLEDLISHVPTEVAVGPVFSCLLRRSMPSDFPQRSCSFKIMNLLGSSLTNMPRLFFGATLLRRFILSTKSFVKNTRLLSIMPGL